MIYFSPQLNSSTIELYYRGGGHSILSRSMAENALPSVSGEENLLVQRTGKP